MYREREREIQDLLASCRSKVHLMHRMGSGIHCLSCMVVSMSDVVYQTVADKSCVCRLGC